MFTESSQSVHQFLLSTKAELERLNSATYLDLELSSYCCSSFILHKFNSSLARLDIIKVRLPSQKGMRC